MANSFWNKLYAKKIICQIVWTPNTEGFHTTLLFLLRQPTTVSQMIIKLERRFLLIMSNILKKFPPPAVIYWVLIAKRQWYNYFYYQQRTLPERRFCIDYVQQVEKFSASGILLSFWLTKDSDALTLYHR